jgi:hypothetical protein
MKCTSGDKIHKHKTDEVSCTCEGEEKYIPKFGGEVWKAEATWKRMSIWEYNIKINVQKI